MKIQTIFKGASISAAAMIAGLASPAWADATAPCNVGTGAESTECGVDATAPQAGGTAVGDGATADGPSAVNPIFASVALGYNTLAHDNAVAIGNTAIARFGGTANPLATGINSAVAVGAGAVSVGSNTIAIGTTSRAGTGFAFNTPGDPVNAGSNITVIGGRAEANQNDATAIGANSNVGAERGTALGSQTDVTQGGGVAIGYGALAQGPSVTNTIFSSIAIGHLALANDNATAIGNNAIARFSGTANPLATGINSAVAHGAGAVAVGSNTVAIGTTARAGTGFAFNTPGDAVDAGSNITVIGGRAEANVVGATAIGANSNVSGAAGVAVGQNTVVDSSNAIAMGNGATTAFGANGAVVIGSAASASGTAQQGVAIGNGSLVTAEGAVALGSGSVADQAYTVSVGTSGFERRITNVAAGTGATDAVNVGQLNTAIAGVSGSAAAAQGTANTALANAAAAQGTANTALTTANGAVAQNLVQDGQITAIQAVNATQTTQIAAIQTVNTTQDTRLTAVETLNAAQATQIGGLQALTATHSAQISDLFTLSDRDRRQARRGTATALALTAAPMPSNPGGVGYALNVSNYRSEQALGLSVAIRTNGENPFAITAGASFAGSKDIGARVGIAGEF